MINRIKSILLSTSLCSLLFSMASCDSFDCPINNVVYGTYGFYVNENGVESAVNVLDTLTVVTAGSDSILVNRIQDVGSVELPVSYSATTDTLVFRFTDINGLMREDSVFIDKENTPHYESPDCPASIFHYVTAVRHTNILIESISIVNPNIDYNVSENFKIFFHSGN